MSRVSLIDHRTLRFVPLRHHYAAICDTSACAALLLAVFDFHTAQRLNDIERRERLGDPPHPDGLWITASIAWLEDELYGAFGRTAVRTAVDLLKEKGYVTCRSHPERKMDRALQYLLAIEVVNEAIGRFVTIDDQASTDLDAGGDHLHPQDHDDHARVPDEGREPEREPREPTDIEIVWAHYVSVFNATRMRLDAKRRRTIKNALAVRTVAECKRAIDGLRVSEHHNGGPNGDGQKYLDITYALHGRTVSDDSWIDSMIELAEKNAPVLNGKLPSDHHKVQRALREVRYTVSTQGEKARGRAAFERLVGWGYKPKRLDEAPWVVLETA